MEQEATVSIGDSPANTPLKKITVTFPKPFAAVPVVIANTLQTDPAYPAGSISDTFAVSVTGASKTGFTANIIRVDAPGHGWGQQLSLGYAATTP